MAVQAVHEAALGEFGRGMRTLSGAADLQLVGPRGGFDEGLYATVLARPEVAAASPVIEIEARVPGTDESLKLLGVDEVRLLTNNPRKVEILTEAGINIVERVPLIVGRNPKNAHYLDTKAAKMGHLLSE